MNKTNTLLLISLATLTFGVAPVLASEPETQQTVAMMGTQPAPVVDDVAIQKAIQTLIKQQNQTIDLKKKVPLNKLDNPVGEHPLRNNNLILGGAEAIPM